MKRENTNIGRRRFLQTSGAAGAIAATGLPLTMLRTRQSDASTAAASNLGPHNTVITKNICHQCPARCGIDVYTTNGRVHAIYGDTDNPIANGKLCPKGHLGTYLLYDPDRFKGPMKRTNPNKGRNEDPGFVPISWEEALDTVAARLNRLRANGESHRVAHFYGRGWGSTDAGLYGNFGKLYGTPNSAIGHASICAEGSKRAKQAVDGNNGYNAYDYENTNYLLNFGAGFLEAFRPYNYLMQVWGKMRTKSPKTRVTSVDIRMSPTAAAADRYLMIKPGTDGALALALAHVILTEGLWDREFVGDFVDGRNQFQTGRAIDPASFEDRWTKDIAAWWNQELKDRTPEWAEEITTIPARQIYEVAREFATTKPAIAIMERGATAHFNGTYNGMAIHALNALAGSLYVEGGMFNQMGVPYGPLPINADDYMDDYAKEVAGRYPRIDMARTPEWPMCGTMMQESARNHVAGTPYKLDTAFFYSTNPIWSAPDPQVWEEALKDVFVIDTSPYPGETAMYADLVLPEHTYLERMQDSPTYPFQGWPMTALRVPAVEPLYDTKHFGDTFIEIGKRLDGPTGEYYRQLGNTENILRHIAKGFEANPGDNGVNSFETWKEKGVWYKKPYHWRFHRGKFWEWDGDGYNVEMDEAGVQAKLIKTDSGKFEFKSSLLEKHAAYITAEMGIPGDRVGLIQWAPPRYTGGGDVHLVTPKNPLKAEGRSANLPQAQAFFQPVSGGRGTCYLEIHPRTARERGIRNGDTVKITAEVRGQQHSVRAVARYVAAHRPDTVILPHEYGHWAQGRWATAEGPVMKPGNVSEVIENLSDPISGLAANYSSMVRLEKA